MAGHLAVSIGAVFAQVLLVGLVYVRLLQLRLRDLQSKRIHIRDIALSNAAWEKLVQQAGNNLANQFEMPVLLYACVGLAAATGAGGRVMAGACVAFVASRWLHAWIHLGSNRVPRRFFTFAFGGCALAVAWLALGIGLLRLA